jgi:hypothetical protein
MLNFFRRHRLGLAVLLLFALLGATAWYKLLREVPVRYASDVDHFKYGSVGVEAANGLPYSVWAVLPDVFADLAGGSGVMPPLASCRKRTIKPPSACLSRPSAFRALVSIVASAT